MVSVMGIFIWLARVFMNEHLFELDIFVDVR